MGDLTYSVGLKNQEYDPDRGLDESINSGNIISIKLDLIFNKYCL